VAAARRRLTGVMQGGVGVLRRGDDLREALDELDDITSGLALATMDVQSYELLNLLTVGRQIAKCALLREESRGVHLRDDFPEVDDARWKRHLTLRLPEDERGEEWVRRA
jgi:L-aspartate oxidase